MIEELLSSTLVGLRRENAELADAIQKWSSFLVGRVNKASLQTDTDPEDIFSEMMLGLLKVGEMYSRPLYRHNGNLYYIYQFDGASVCIKTLDSNVSFKREVWTDCSNLQKVRRGSLSSSVYREINQKYCNLLNAAFSAKNGYEKTDGGERAILTRSGSSRLVTKKKKVYNLRKVVHHVGLTNDRIEEPSYDTHSHPTSREVSDYLSDISNDPERGFSSREIFRGLDKRLSPQARAVLGALVEDPSLPDKTLASMVKIPSRAISLARMEILRDYDDVGGVPLPAIPGKHPVYLRASQAC